MASHRNAPELIETLLSALPGSLATLARNGEARRYRRGTLLIEEGDRGDALIIILSGRLRAFSRHPTNGREITYGVYGAGEYVGEMGLDGGPRSASVEVLDPSLCVRIDRPTLEAHIAAHPAFALELLAKVIRRARSATLGLKQIALNDVYGRLKALLEELAAERPDGRRSIAPRPTHLELSQRLGCGREMISRVMKDLERGDYVASEGRTLILRRPLPLRW